jgi:HEPN domain-containing protein
MTFDEKDKTKYVPRDQWPGYFETAKECHTCMHNEYRDGRYRSAGLSAIQTVISAGDAVLISQTGQTPGNHHFAASVLGKQFTSPEGQSMVKAYSKVLGKKTELQYEGKDLSPETAKELLDCADEVMRFASRKLNT